MTLSLIARSSVVYAVSANQLGEGAVDSPLNDSRAGPVRARDLTCSIDGTGSGDCVLAKA